MPANTRSADPEVAITVVGGGAVGTAVAAALAGRRGGVVLLEAGPRLGAGITSRNSGVIHSGLYYTPGSLKAETCVRGNRLLYEWCAAHEVPHAAIGKLVLAQTPAECEALEALRRNADACGAEGLRWVESGAIESLDPAARGNRALYCERSGIVDAEALTRSLARAAEASGALVLTHARVSGIDALGRGYRLETTRGPIVTEAVVNAAGLHADEVAFLAGIDHYRIYPCRGDYFTLRTATPLRRLLYPVKDPLAPGLGIHVTVDLAGRARLGPDAEYVERKDDFRPAPEKAAAFHRAAERLLGPLSPEAVAHDSVGIRPKLRGPNDSGERDFIVAEDRPGFVNLVGIESPGLTAALALAERVVAVLT